MADKKQVLEALAKVPYPGFSKDIVSLGAVRDVDASPDSIVVSLKTISADDSVIDRLKEAVRAALADMAGRAEVFVLVGDEAAASKKQEAHTHGHGDSPFVRRKLPGVKNIVPVVSGKGGVGKSTVAVNLAYTLAQLGNKTGLLDLDLFGPSVHRMLNARASLEVSGNLIVPFERDGLKIISIGMALEDEEALIIRGPMVMKLVNQLLNQVNWGELDYLVVDMPPGTGDIPLSLVQQLDVTGAVVVTTPQDIALVDVRRAVSMFQQTQTSILGLVENMSHYVCEKCGDVAYIFGKEGGQNEAAKLGLPLLAQIPLVKSICEEADAGNPIFDRKKSPELAKVFEQLAGKVKSQIAVKEELTADQCGTFDYFSHTGGG
ncbi:MAG: Mrp/NBP35 family ATP-binding protein [Nitrospinae bacterium]|nr:Mrp/NBP35 family ATP-binding protein [Nitrospinota bacterium]